MTTLASQFTSVSRAFNDLLGAQPGAKTGVEDPVGRINLLQKHVKNSISSNLRDCERIQNTTILLTTGVAQTCFKLLALITFCIAPTAFFCFSGFPIAVCAVVFLVTNSIAIDTIKSGILLKKKTAALILMLNAMQEGKFTKALNLIKELNRGMQHDLSYLSYYQHTAAYLKDIYIIKNGEKPQTTGSKLDPLECEGCKYNGITLYNGFIMDPMMQTLWIPIIKAYKDLAKEHQTIDEFTTSPKPSALT